MTTLGRREFCSRSRSKERTASATNGSEVIAWARGPARPQVSPGGPKPSRRRGSAHERDHRPSEAPFRPGSWTRAVQFVSAPSDTVPTGRFPRSGEPAGSWSAGSAALRPEAGDVAAARRSPRNDGADRAGPPRGQADRRPARSVTGSGRRTAIIGIVRPGRRRPSRAVIVGIAWPVSPAAVILGGRGGRESGREQQGRERRTIEPCSQGH